MISSFSSQSRCTWEPVGKWYVPVADRLGEGHHARVYG